MADRFKAVAFDLDGTLVNSGQGLAEAVDLMLKTLGYPTVGIEKVGTWIGNGAVNLVETALKNVAGEQGLTQFDEAFALFNRFYTEVLEQGSELYPGVYETLMKLHNDGFQLALITNKPSQFLPRLLQDLKVAQFFDLVLGADDVAARKPHPAPIFQTLGYFGLLQAELLFVGDSRNDIQAAKSAGVQTVGVTYGYNFGEMITHENPTYVIDHFSELLSIVR